MDALFKIRLRKYGKDKFEEIWVRSLLMNNYALTYVKQDGTTIGVMFKDIAVLSVSPYYFKR